MDREPVPARSPVNESLWWITVRPESEPTFEVVLLASGFDAARELAHLAYPEATIDWPRSSRP